MGFCGPVAAPFKAPFGGGVVAVVPITWRLRDDFLTDLAAGSVNGTAAEPGPGTRIVTDTTPVLALVSDQAVFPNSGISADPRLSYLMARAATRIGVVQLESNGSFNAGPYAGWDDAATGLINRLAFRLGNSTADFYAQVAQIAFMCGEGVLTAGAKYNLWLIARAAGGFVFIQGESFPYPTLLYVDKAYAVASTHFGVTRATSCNFDINTIRIADETANFWVPAPLASDSFNRANGALGNTDGLAHEEAGDPVGGGGDGLAWTAQAGTWGIATNVAACSALAGGIGIATVPCGDQDVVATCNLTRAGGNVGLVLRYTNANNYLICYHDGTNIKLDQIVAGVTTNLVTAATAYAAAGTVQVRLSGRQAWVNYRSTSILGETEKINESLIGTAHGLYTTNTGNSMNDLIIYAGGSDNEHAALVPYAPALTSYYADSDEYDVFVVAGQSNAGGRGDNYQTYTGATARNLREDYRWKALADPTDSTEDFGSPWPLVANLLEAATGRKFAFICVAAGSTGLVNPANWPQAGVNYVILQNAVAKSRVKDIMGILWIQGEQDAFNGVGEAAYEAALSLMLDNLQADTGLSGLKLVCGMIANVALAAAADINNIRKAQADVWAADADVYPGPTGHDQAFADGVHWTTDAQMATLAGRWARTILAAFYGGAEADRGPIVSTVTRVGVTVTVVFTGGQGVLQNQDDPTGFVFTDGGVPIAITGSVANGTDGVDLTLAGLPAGAELLSFCSGNTGAGATLCDSGTYPLPPEPFVAHAVA